MDAFKLKKIRDEGEIFSQKISSLRIEKKLELDSIAEKIGIKKDYLEAIENNRLDLIPAGIYKKSYLKKYSEFVGLDRESVAKRLKELKEEENEDPFSKKVVSRDKLLVFPKIIKTTLFSLAILFCALYLLFYLKRIAAPPNLTINYPQNNLLTEERSVIVKGQTDPEVELKINNELVLSNDNGHFSQEVNLKTGINNISISAKKKYSRENIIIKQVLVE